MMIKTAIHRIRCRIDEPYRIKTGFGLSPLRNQREVKALIGFCRSELKDTAHMELNPERRAVYQATVQIYDKPLNPVELNGEKYYSLMRIVDDHCGWYWN